MGNVKVIPATVNRFTQAPLRSARRKVAGYARVSTDLEEQATSYEAQMAYYTEYINSRPDWEFAGMYSDEGISGTNTKHREGFNRMVADALDGKIDLIITKSVSRFARNTVDSLTTVRKLKDKGVEVYFEKENIYTLDSKGELLITIMSSLAQEESRSISENVTWGKRKLMASGKVFIPYTIMMGFTKDKATGKYVADPEKADTVRLIFDLFLSGKSVTGIARELTARGIKSPMGKDKWVAPTVYKMLTNEKYCGDALLQKSFTVNFLEKKTKQNEGEVPQYYVEGSHEAIVDGKIFQLGQARLRTRKRGGLLGGKVVCACCGGTYGAKVWHSTDKYRKVIYRCNQKYKGERCTSRAVSEEEVKAAVVRAFSRLMENKEEVLENLKLIQAELCDTKELEAAKAGREKEMEQLDEELDALIADNARRAQDQEEYTRRFDKLAREYDAAKADAGRLKEKIEARKEKSLELEAFADALEPEYDDRLFNALVEKVVVGDKIKVVFKNDVEV